MNDSASFQIVYLHLRLLAITLVTKCCGECKPQTINRAPLLKPAFKSYLVKKNTKLKNEKGYSSIIYLFIYLFIYL